MDQRQLKRTARNKILLCLLFLGVIFVAEVVGVITVIFLDLPDTSLWTSIIPEATGAAAAVLGVIVIGGLKWVSTSKDDIFFTFRFGWWCIAISLALMTLDLVDYATSDTSIASDALPRLFEVALLCLLIGIFEEFMFRGIIFNGLLAGLGGTHRGVVIAIMITSVIFGAAHVDFSSDFSEPIMALQGLLKIVQTGMYSILLCVIVLRTRKLGGASLFHAFDDFVLIFPSVALHQEKMETEYVVAGDDAMPTTILYLVIIALYTPFVIKALLELRRGQDVYRGVFMEGAVERAALAAQGGAQGDPAMLTGAPVAPVPGVAQPYGMPAYQMPGVAGEAPAAPFGYQGGMPTGIPTQTNPPSWSEVPQQATSPVQSYPETPSWQPQTFQGQGQPYVPAAPQQAGAGYSQQAYQQGWPQAVPQVAQTDGAQRASFGLDAQVIQTAAAYGQAVPSFPLQQQVPAGYLVQQPQASYPAQQAPVGYQAQSAQTGYPVQQAQTGYPAQQGYPTQQVSAGYPVQQPQAGYPAQQAQAGYPAQQDQPTQWAPASHPTQQVPAGYQAQQGTALDTAQQEQTWRSDAGQSRPNPSVSGCDQSHQADNTPPTPTGL